MVVSLPRTGNVITAYRKHHYPTAVTALPDRGKEVYSREFAHRMRTLLQRFTPHRMHGAHSMFAEAIFRGCTCPKCTNRARSAVKKNLTQMSDFHRFDGCVEITTD